METTIQIKMEIPEKYNYIKKEIERFYVGRDISHDFSHVEQVCKNALYIANYIGNLDDSSELLLVISALGHDIWDHKYVNSGEEHMKKASFMTILFVCGVSSIIIVNSIKIIDSISLSKEMELRKIGKTLELPHDIIFIRNIVSDADKLESLGAVCIKRMIQYGIHKNVGSIKEHFNHIKNHSVNLYKLLDDNYIITDIGRKLAEPRMIEIKNIVDDDDKLQNFICKNI